MYTFLFQTLLFVLCFFSADSVRGVVRDPSGAVVAGARVELIVGGNTLLRQTDALGQFDFDDVPAHSYLVRVSAEGFQRYESTIRFPIDSLAVTLDVSSHAQNVVVTATRTETPAALIGSSISVIRAEDIRQQQASTVLEVLRDVPGLIVSNTSRRGGTTAVHTRGANRNANLVLIDGIQINDPGGDLNLTHLTTANVERIEVVRGPQSALYGSDAAASVIQVFTRQGKPEDGAVSGSASLEGGTFGTFRSMAAVSGVIHATDYSFAAERLQTNGAFPNDAYRNFVFSGNFGYRLRPDSDVRLTVRTTDSRVGVPNRVGFSIIDRDAYRKAQTIVAGARYSRNGDRYSQRFQLGYVRFRDFFDDRLEDGPFTIGGIVRGTPNARGSAGVRLVEFISPERLAAGYYQLPPDARLVTRTIRLRPSGEFRQTLERRTGEYNGTVHYRNGSTLMFGYEFEQERGKSATVEPLRNNHGLYMHHQHPLSQRLFLTESVRFERNSVFGRKATPRLSASYSLGQTTRLKSSWGLGITEPSFLQNFANDPSFVGNRNLRPERTQSVDAGIERRVFNRAVVDATFFHNHFRNLIAFVSVPLPGRSTWENVEASRATGLELSFSMDPVAWFRISSQYTFLDTRVLKAVVPASTLSGVGQELPRRPRHSGAINAVATAGRLMFNVNGTFIGERQDSDGVGFGVVRNPRFQKIDIGMNVRLHRSFELFGRVENVLNQKYQEVLGYASLPLNALTGLRVYWGK